MPKLITWKRADWFSTSEVSWKKRVILTCSLRDEKSSQLISSQNQAPLFHSSFNSWWNVFVRIMERQAPNVINRKLCILFQESRVRSLKGNKYFCVRNVRTRIWNESKWNSGAMHLWCSMSFFLWLNKAILIFHVFLTSSLSWELVQQDVFNLVFNWSKWTMIWPCHQNNFFGSKKMLKTVKTKVSLAHPPFLSPRDAEKRRNHN